MLNLFLGYILSLHQVPRLLQLRPLLIDNRNYVLTRRHQIIIASELVDDFGVKDGADTRRRVAEL